MMRLVSASLLLALFFGVGVPAVRPQGSTARPAVPSTLHFASAAEDDTTGLVTREDLINYRLTRLGIDTADPAPTHPRNKADSLEWDRHRRAAERITGFKVVISIYDRRLWLMNGHDTLFAAEAGVGMGVVERKGRRFDFSTPRGPRRVLAKEENPLWIPPDWHYLEIADRVRHFPARGIELSGGDAVIRRGNRIGILRGGHFEALPPEHPLTFNGVTYIPPHGTVNRQVREVLGKFKLDTGAGILIHGTNDPLSVGLPATHGCIRLADTTLEQVYQAVEVGTPVYIY